MARWTGKTAGFRVKVEELTGDLSEVRLSTPLRARESPPGRPCPASLASPAISPSTLPRSSPPPPRRFAILEAGIVSEETYVEQGFYWDTGHTP